LFREGIRRGEATARNSHPSFYEGEREKSEELVNKLV